MLSVKVKRSKAHGYLSHPDKPYTFHPAHRAHWVIRVGGMRGLEIRVTAPVMRAVRNDGKPVTPEHRWSTDTRIR